MSSDYSVRSLQTKGSGVRGSEGYRVCGSEI